MIMTMPQRCQLCSSVSCCATWQPPLPVEMRLPEAPYQEFARLFPDPRNRLGYWGGTVVPATRARARVARTREGFY